MPLSSIQVVLYVWYMVVIVLYLLVVWLPVSPEEVFLLLSDFWESVSVTQLSHLLSVAIRQGVISGRPVALKQNKKVQIKTLLLPTVP